MADGSRDLSQAEKEKNACKVEQIHKMTTIFIQNGNLGPFLVKIVVILWICSALQAVFSFSAWDKSSGPTSRGHVDHLSWSSGKKYKAPQPPMETTRLTQSYRVLPKD